MSTTRGVNSTFLRSKDSGLPDFVMEFELQRGLVGFAGANANNLFHCRDENLAIANFTSMRGLDNGFNCRIEQIRRDYHLDFNLGQEVHHIFRAAVQLGMPFLSAETLH